MKPNKFTIIRYLQDDKSKRMTDILEDLYFSAENWDSYAKINLPVIIKNAWQRFKDTTGSFVNKCMVVSKVNMHFMDNNNLSSPVIDTIELELGDGKHVVRIWTEQGLKFDPEYKGTERLIRHAGVPKNRALVIMIVTKDTSEETWDRLYRALEHIGLECEVHYHTEAIYEIEMTEE